jgi:hypothetical protein
VTDNSNVTWYDCLWMYNDYQLYCGAGGGQIWYTTIPSGIKQINNNVPDKYSLSQNYPNPFNPSTNIKFDIAKTGNVYLSVYDISGREVDVLVNGKLNAGTYYVNFDASRFSSGAYIYRITAGNFTKTNKMILIK